MNTLIIYDNTGHIYYQGIGMPEPAGIPFMYVEVPQGKYLDRMDVTEEVDTPIFADFPQSQVDLLKERLGLIQQALDDLIMGGAL